MQSLKGRVALVAGATRGAGRGIARALGEARRGRLLHGTQRPRTAVAVRASRDDRRDRGDGQQHGRRRHCHARRSHRGIGGRRALRAHRSRAWPARRAGELCRRRRPDDAPVGIVLEDRSEGRRSDLQAMHPVAHDHGQARRTADDSRAPRPDRRGDRGRHAVCRRQPAHADGEARPQGTGAEHGGGAASARRRRRRGRSGISSF